MGLLKHFSPKPGRFGVMPVIISTGVLGDFTANTDTPFYIPVPEGDYYFASANYQTVTVPADSDGVITALVKKYRAVENDEVTLSVALDLELAVTRERLPFSLAGITDINRVLHTGDTLLVDVTNDSAALTTQHVNAFFVVELYALR